MSDAITVLESVFDEHLAVARASREQLLPQVEALAADIARSLAAGGKLLTCGNGGSAADAQHFSGELLGHFKRDRDSLAAIALTTDTSTLTAIANDYSYERVFARQVEALCGPDDVLVGISTSGNAANVLAAVRVARDIGASTWGLTGATGGGLATAAEHVIHVPTDETARIQEMHITVIHAVSELLDR